MKYIVRYENFNESKGISDSCEKILNEIWLKIEYDINNLLTNEINFDRIYLTDDINKAIEFGEYLKSINDNEWYKNGYWTWRVKTLF